MFMHFIKYILAFFIIGLIGTVWPLGGELLICGIFGYGLWKAVE